MPLSKESVILKLIHNYDFFPLRVQLGKNKVILLLANAIPRVIEQKLARHFQNLSTVGTAALLTTWRFI